MADAEELGALLLGAVANLRTGATENALDALAVLFADPDFGAATDLDDVKARAACLRAQALLTLGRPAEAGQWNQIAMRLAETLGDGPGLAEIHAQQDAIRAAVTVVAQQNAAIQHSRRLAELSVDQILIGLGSGTDRADALVKKANAEIDVGRSADAAAVARRAIEEAVGAGALKEEVFARIALARANPPEAPSQLLTAWRRAERENEFNLVTAVAAACELLSVRLPALVGPGGEA